MKLLLVFLTPLALALQSDYNEENTKLIEEFFLKRPELGLPWNQPSAAAKHVALSRKDDCDIPKVPCLYASKWCNQKHTSSCAPSKGCQPPKCECHAGWTTLPNSQNKLQCDDDLDECANGNPCQN